MASRVVISADSHTDLYLDLKPFLESKYHTQFDELVAADEARFFKMLRFSSGIPKPVNPSKRPAQVSEYRISYTLAERLERIDADGVAAEFILESGGARSADPEFQHACNLAYNRWFGAYTAPARWRFSGATVVTLTDMAKTVQEIRHAHENGLRAVHLSGALRLVSPDLPPYNDRYYTPMWETLNELEMAVVFHPGVGREKPLLAWEGTEPGWEPLRFRDVKFGHREALPFFLLAGIPERYPKLKIGYVESHSTWLPPLLEELDNLVRNRRPEASLQLELLPSEQFRRQCFAAGPLKPEEVEARHLVGVGNLMWGSDFPHPEGTYPYSRENLDALLAGIPAAEAAALAGANAARFLGFDLERLAETPAAH